MAGMFNKQHKDHDHEKTVDIKHDPADKGPVDHSHDHVDKHPTPGSAAYPGAPAETGPKLVQDESPTTPSRKTPGAGPDEPRVDMDHHFEKLIDGLKTHDQTNEVMAIVARIDEAKMMFHNHLNRIKAAK